MTAIELKRAAHAAYMREYYRKEKPEKRKLRLAYYRAYHKANFERDRVVKRAYAATHKEQARASVLKWRANSVNRKREQERARLRYLKVRKEHHAQTRLWRINNPERNKEHRRRYRKTHTVERAIYKAVRRAREKGVTIDKSANAFYRRLRTTANLTCFYCGIAITGRTAHADHVIPISRGGSHSESNLVPACSACNFDKCDKLLSEWIPPLRQPVLTSGKEG